MVLLAQRKQQQLGRDAVVRPANSGDNLHSGDDGDDHNEEYCCWEVVAGAVEAQKQPQEENNEVVAEMRQWESKWRDVVEA